MSLSFSEKRALQRTVQEKIQQLETGSLSFQEKRAAQRSLEESLAKLEERASSNHSSKLDDLVAGKFNALEPMPFLSVLEEIVKELGGVIDPVKDPACEYVRLHQDLIVEDAASKIQKAPL